MPTKKKASSKAASKRKKAADKPVIQQSYEDALKEYSAALELLQKGDFPAAREKFREVETKYPAEQGLVDRSKVYADICARKIEAAPEPPKTAEEFYNQGVLKANDGDLAEAHEFLTLALQGEPESPRILYARATVKAMDGKVEEAVADLRRAIAVEPTIRYQAINDSDFEKIRDEAAFIDLIEPTPTGA